jgi:hypothetical protein
MQILILAAGKAWDILVNKAKEVTIHKVLKCLKVEVIHKEDQCMEVMDKVVKVGVNNNFTCRFMLRVASNTYTIHRDVPSLHY